MPTAYPRHLSARTSHWRRRCGPARPGCGVRPPRLGQPLLPPRPRANWAGLLTAEAKNEPIEPTKLTVALAAPDGACQRRITRKAPKKENAILPTAFSRASK